MHLILHIPLFFTQGLAGPGGEGWPQMALLTLVSVEGSPGMWNSSKGKPFREVSMCIQVLTPLPMSYLVNLSFRFEVLMSTWLHSAFISAFSPAMLLQDTWKCTYLRWLTQIGCSIPSTGPVVAWGPYLAGPESDRWTNPAKNPVASSTVGPAKLVSFLPVPAPYNKWQGTLSFLQARGSQEKSAICHLGICRILNPSPIALC